MLNRNEEIVYTYTPNEKRDELVANLPYLAPQIFKRNGEVKSPKRGTVLKASFTERMNCFFSARKMVEIDTKLGTEPKLMISCLGMTITFTGDTAELLAWDDDHQYLSKLIGAGWNVCA